MKPMICAGTAALALLAAGAAAAQDWGRNWGPEAAWSAPASPAYAQPVYASPVQAPWPAPSAWSAPAYGGYGDYGGWGPGPETVRLPASFFAGAGGVGPQGLVLDTGVRWGYVIWPSRPVAAFASARASAFASAHASSRVSVSVR
ncbi:MAG: hypothetical protein IIZ63_15060 [Caulobacteraceae bacterium]|nr:hypothetical protein [Caulobacteraceae bacterium]